MTEEIRERQRKEQIGQKEAANITPMKPLTQDAYGGGLYGHDDDEGGGQKQSSKTPASETQSADGPSGPTAPPKHKPPPSTGDRDLDITGMSYIQ